MKFKQSEEQNKGKSVVMVNPDITKRNKENRDKTIMSDREFWVTNSVRLQNRIIRWLDIRFPEYFSVFEDWTCKRSLATL